MGFACYLCLPLGLELRSSDHSAARPPPLGPLRAAAPRLRRAARVHRAAPAVPRAVIAQRWQRSALGEGSGGHRIEERRCKPRRAAFGKVRTLEILILRAKNSRRSEAAT